MDFRSVATILEFLSKAITFLLAIGGIVAFVFRESFSKWLDARFKRQVDAQLEELKHSLSLSLESTKVKLAQELATQTETLKAKLTKNLEREKRVLDESFRRKAQTYDQRSKHFELFATTYSNIFADLYSWDPTHLPALDAQASQVRNVMKEQTLQRMHILLL